MVVNAGYSIFTHSRPEASGLRGFCLFILLNMFYGLSAKETVQMLYPAFNLVKK